LSLGWSLLFSLTLLMLGRKQLPAVLLLPEALLLLLLLPPALYVK
jgi:hypothetical protein